jgi:hypothetical protein
VVLNSFATWRFLTQSHEPAEELEPQNTTELWPLVMEREDLSLLRVFFLMRSIRDHSPRLETERTYSGRRP